MSTQHHIARVRNAVLAMSLVMMTIVVAHPAVVSAGSMQGTIVPSPNATGAASWSIVTSPNTSTTQNNDLENVSCISSTWCVAVGYYYTGTYDQTLIEQWNGTSWSIVTSPDTSTTANNYLYGVSCVSSSDCMAVGYYINSLASWQTLVEGWNGSAWSIVTSPNTSTTQSNDLAAVSCTSSTDCVAAGSYNDGLYDQTLVEEWNGSAWSIVTSPNAGGQNDLLYGVSCVSSSDCMAVGYYYGTYTQTLVEQWNGTSWSIVTSPDTSTTQDNYLYSVSCTSSTDCMAVGYYYGTYDYTLVVQWNGTGWSIVTSPNTSTTQSNDLYGVSCVSSSDCTAVGSYNTGSYDQTLVEAWNGTSWSIVSSPNTSTTQDNWLYSVSCVSSSDCTAVASYTTGSYDQTLIEQFAPAMQNSDLYSVSCTSSTDCMAVGYYYGTYDQTLIEQWNGTSWSIVSSPNTSTTQDNYLYGVTCVSSSSCVAVGYYLSNTDQTLVEQWNGTSWSIVTSPNMVPASGEEQNQLLNVNCMSTSSCLAVGAYFNSTDAVEQTLVEQWNGTSWAIVTSPNTSTTQNNYLYGVSCVSNSSCMAVGYYINSGGYNQTLIEEWNGTSWSIATSQNTSTTQNNYLYGVNCVSASDCMAVGSYNNSGGYNQTLVEQWNGTSWSIVTSPDTSTTQNNQLQSVSCASSSACMAVGFNFGSYDQTLVEEWNGSSWSIVTSPNTSTTENNWLNGVSCVTTSECLSAGFYTDTGGYDQTLIEQFTMVCSGGALSLNIPSAAAFPSLTLNGTNQTSMLPLAFTPDDETGTGNGWNIDVTSITFTNSAGDTLPTTASTVTGVSSVTAAPGNCSLPTNTISPYPITVPAGTTAPAAVPIYSANTGTGEGPSNIALNFAVAVPANTYSGTYTSIWTFTIASGP